MSYYRSRSYRRSGTFALVGLLPFLCGALVFLFACVLVLGSFLRFERAEELNTDYTMTLTRVGVEDDHESNPAFDGLWSNTPVAGSETNFDDPTQKGITAAGAPLGKLETWDEGVKIGVSLEDMTVRDADANVVLSTSEREAGYINNEENTRIYDGGKNLLASINEREVAFEKAETETVYVIEDGKQVDIVQVKEFGTVSREAVRDGTETVDARFDFTHKTEYDTGKGFFFKSAASADAYVNGQLAYTVEPVIAHNPGLGLFDALVIKDPSGDEIARIDYDNKLFKASTILTFTSGDYTYGQIFIRPEFSSVYSTPTGKSCWYNNDNHTCSVTTYYVSWNLTGTTPEEKLESLRAIDMIMALMPDHINKNNLGLHEAEEFSDALMILLDQDPANLVKYGVALNQEEDSMTVFEAYEYFFHR